MANDDTGHAREGCTDHVELGPVQADLVPDRGHLDAQVGVVGQQRLTGDRLGAVHYPVVASHGRCQSLTQSNHPLDRLVARQRRSPQSGVVLRLGRDDQGAILRVGRQQLLGPLLTQSLDQLRPEQLVTPIAPQVPGHDFAPDEAVQGFPRLGRVTQDPEFQGEVPPMALDEGVDPLRVSPKGAQCLLVGQGQVGGRRAGQAERAQEAICLEGRLAEHFRQAAMPNTAVEIHLPQPVLGVDITLGEV